MTEFNGMEHLLEMDAEINKVRRTLNFQDAVQESFKFLVDEYSFTCAGANILLVKYESKDVFVKIYHDRLSYELELYVGLLAKDNKKDETKYSISSIMGLAGYDYYENFKARSSDEINEYVPKLAEYLKTYGIKAVSGDHTYFDQLAKYSDKSSFKLNVEWKGRFIARDGEPAWENKDFKKVVEVYSRWEPFLSSEEKSKLEYARKRLTSPNHQEEI